MSKILNVLTENLDKAWYDSSTIIYSECDDIEGELKTVRVTFKDGRTYAYKGVKVNDYLMFREHMSQGKALNSFLKKYECERIDNCNVDDIKEKLNEILHPEDKVLITDKNVKVIKNNNEVLSTEIETNNDINTLKEILNALNIKWYEEN